MKSVVSYPDRGKWGKSNWRGNTSGHIIVDLIEHFKPKLFVDVCEGSGTSGEVCQDMGIQYVGLDLHKGNDFTRDFVLSQLPRPADICFSHPPYANMIQYSGAVWGSNPIDGDTSLCGVDEFLEKSQVMLLNQREATRDGGIYTTLIGDMRKNGDYRSFQADFIQMMPKSELLNVIIKVQHNMMSSKTQYSGARFIPITHEYLLIWKKTAKSLFAVTWEKAKEIKKQIAATWRSAIRIALMKLGGKAALKEIYAEVEQIAQNLIQNNKNWQAKVRQQLQYHFTSVERGVWALN